MCEGGYSRRLGEENVYHDLFSFCIIFLPAFCTMFLLTDFFVILLRSPNIYYKKKHLINSYVAGMKKKFVWQ